MALPEQVKRVFNAAKSIRAIKSGTAALRNYANNHHTITWTANNGNRVALRVSDTGIAKMFMVGTTNHLQTLINLMTQNSTETGNTVSNDYRIISDIHSEITETGSNIQIDSESVKSGELPLNGKPSEQVKNFIGGSNVQTVNDIEPVDELDDVGNEETKNGVFLALAIGLGIYLFLKRK